MSNEIRVALSDIVLTFVPQHNSHNQCDKSSAESRRRKRWCLVSLVVWIVVVSPIEQIGYGYRKLRAKFALRKSTTLNPAIAPPWKHSHALDMFNGQRTQCIHQRARQMFWDAREEFDRPGRGRWIDSAEDLQSSALRNVDSSHHVTHPQPASALRRHPGFTTYNRWACRSSYKHLTRHIVADESELVGANDMSWRNAFRKAW